MEIIISFVLYYDLNMNESHDNVTFCSQFTSKKNTIQGRGQNIQLCHKLLRYITPITRSKVRSKAASYLNVITGVVGLEDPLYQTMYNTFDSVKDVCRGERALMLAFKYR